MIADGYGNQFESDSDFILGKPMIPEGADLDPERTQRLEYLKEWDRIKQENAPPPPPVHDAPMPMDGNEIGAIPGQQYAQLETQNQPLERAPLSDLITNQPAPIMTSGASADVGINAAPGVSELLFGKTPMDPNIALEQGPVEAKEVPPEEVKSYGHEITQFDRALAKLLGASISGRTSTVGTEERYQLWPERAVRAAVDATYLPGELLSGKTDWSDPKTFERAMELAPFAVLGMAPLKAASIAKKAAENPKIFEDFAPLLSKEASDSIKGSFKSLEDEIASLMKDLEKDPYFAARKKISQDQPDLPPEVKQNIINRAQEKGTQNFDEIYAQFRADYEDFLKAWDKHPDTKGLKKPSEEDYDYAFSRIQDEGGSGFNDFDIIDEVIRQYNKTTKSSASGDAISAAEFEKILQQSKDKAKQEIADSKPPLQKEAPHSFVPKTAQEVEEFTTSLVEEMAVLKAYAGAAYHKLNEALWQGGKDMHPAIQRQVEKMDALFSKSVLLKDVTTFRGIGASKMQEIINRYGPLKEGKIISFPGYTSTSFAPSTANQFGKNVFEIKVPKGTKAIDVEKTGVYFSSEKELVLPRNTHFKVKGVNEYGATILEVVPHASL